MANRRLRTAQRNATAAKTSARVSDNITESGTWQTPSAKEEILSQRGTTGTSGLKPTAGMQDVSSQTVPGTNFTYADIGIHSLPTQQDTTQAGRLAQLEGAKNLSGIKTPNQVTIATRPEAGAPLQSPLSGVNGQAGELGFNPAGTVQYVNGQINVSQPEEEPAFPKVAYSSPAQRLGNLQIQAQQEAIEASRAAVKTESLNQQRIKQQSEKEIAAAEATAEGTTPEQVGGNAALANLAKSSPEAQALLPFLEQFQNDIAAQITKNTEFVEGRLGETIDTFDSVDKKIEDMKSEYKTSTEMLNDFLKEAKDDTDKALALQQESLNNQLMWQQATERGKVMRQKAAQHDALVVQLALEGGFGQPAALRGVMETDAKFDQNLQELATFYGYKRVDLAAKFAGLYAENQQNYIKNTSDNLKEMRGAIERITTLGIQNKKDRQTEIDSIMENGFERQDKYITEKSKATLDYAKEIISIIQNDKDDKRLQEKDGWSRLESAIDIYGNNIPEGLLSSISAMLPGVDVSEIAQTKTLEQLKEERLGAGAGSSSSGFSGYGNGTEFSTSLGEVPTFEEFISTKEESEKMSISPQNRETYRKEYDAMVVQENRYSVDSINKLFADKVETNADLAKHTKESARSAVDNALKRGDFQEARRLVEGVGKAPAQKQREGFEQAIIVRQGIAEINALIDDIGLIAPGVGKFREMNPFDSRIVRLEQLTTQVIPGLARGIYKEVGVLTDTDIKTYRSTMANPNLTYEQAKTATEDTMRKIQLSLDTTLESWDASKLNTRDYRAMAERQPDISGVLSPAGTSNVPSASQGGSVSDYVQSLRK